MPLDPAVRRSTGITARVVLKRFLLRCSAGLQLLQPPNLMGRTRKIKQGRAATYPTPQSSSR